MHLHTAATLELTARATKRAGSLLTWRQHKQLDAGLNALYTR